MMTRNNSIHTLRRLKPALLTGAVLLWGCSFDVNNPGAIVEDDLNDLSGIKSLLVGMSSDFSEEYDEIAFTIARAGDEAAGGGSYGSTSLYKAGLIDKTDTDGHWGGIQRARWVAENGLVRMRDKIEGFDFATDPAVGRAYLFAALANRTIGESFCEGVTLASDDLGAGGGSAVPKSEAFNRAIRWATEVIGHAGSTAQLVTAAHGVRAQAYVGVGEWGNAIAETAMVPTDFVHDAIYDGNSGRERNVLYNEGVTRGEYSIYGSLAGGRIFGETLAAYQARVDPATGTSPAQDPRAPYDRCDVNVGTVCNSGAVSAGGVIPRWQQQKYPSRGTEIPVVKGTEMRLIEAEAEIVTNGAAGITNALAKLNEVRTFLGVTPALTATTVNEVWQHIDDERHLTLWLEGRRFHDLDRWDAANLSFLRGVRFTRGETDFSVFNDMEASLAKRATCLPISFDECLSNTNLNCL